jgi:voltage-gated potassium channel
MNIRTVIRLSMQKTGPYGLLLISLFFMISFRPFLDGLVGATLLADILLSCVLLSGIYALSKQQLVLHTACALAFFIFLFKVVYYAYGNQRIFTLQIVLSMLFIAQMLIMILKHLLTEKEVTGDLIMGGACAFVLLGLVWAFAYYLLEIYQPNSFKGIEKRSDDMWDFFYYSFVTLTTLGYGDILAVSKQARGLTVLEAIIGQLYLAIMISRLVSLHIAEARHK